jgi:hypothetical protein
MRGLVLWRLDESGKLTEKQRAREYGVHAKHWWRHFEQEGMSPLRPLMLTDHARERLLERYGLLPENLDLPLFSIHRASSGRGWSHRFRWKGLLHRQAREEVLSRGHSNHTGDVLMDPDQALKKARDALKILREREKTGGGNLEAAVEASKDLEDAFEALDGWFSRGGFLPEDWAKERKEK